jgi:hypothetical protein
MLAMWFTPAGELLLGLLQQVHLMATPEALRVRYLLKSASFMVF